MLVCKYVSAAIGNVLKHITVLKDFADFHIA